MHMSRTGLQDFLLQCGNSSSLQPCPLSQQCTPRYERLARSGFSGECPQEECPSKDCSCTTQLLSWIVSLRQDPEGLSALGDILPTGLALVLPTGKVVIPAVFKTWCHSHQTRLSRWCHLCQWGPVFCTRSHISIHAMPCPPAQSASIVDQILPEMCSGASSPPDSHAKHEPVVAALNFKVDSDRVYCGHSQHTGPSLVFAWLQGRLIDHLRNTQSVGLEDLQALVLDEADRLLQMGFAEEVGHC